MQFTGSRWSWDMTVILVHVPSAPGVYAIWRDETCLYVGEANDLLGRLVLHYKDVNRGFLPAERPTWFWFQACPGIDRTARRSALISRLKPSLNSPAG
jgi:predicted GIY-YIG superfamily endonuclease